MIHVGSCTAEVRYLELLGQGHEEGEIFVRDGHLAEVHEVDQGGEVLEPHIVRHDEHLIIKVK